MANNAPFEIIAAPFDVYITTGGDAKPINTATPSGGWVKIGTSGKKNYAEGGVTVEHGQTIVPIHVEGYTGPVKVIRSQESQLVRFTLLDLHGSQYKHALSGDAPTVTGTSHEIGLTRGLDVREVRLLIRGASPAGTGNAQYYIPRAVQTGSPSVVLQKGAPAGIEMEFMTLADTAAATTGEEFGTFDYLKDN